MKSALLPCFVAAALAGCAAGPEYWDHGEWLDRVSVRPAQVVPHTPQERQQLEADASRLRAEGEQLRQQMVLEKSRVRRMAALQRLEEIGDELRPVEKALRGGPMPVSPLPEQEPFIPGA